MRRSLLLLALATTASASLSTSRANADRPRDVIYCSSIGSLERLIDVAINKLCTQPAL